MTAPRIILLSALLTATAWSGSPKIGCLAEVGNPAGNSRNWALIMLKMIDEAEPHDAYRIYRKPGNAASANPYSLLATIQPMAGPASLSQLLDRAGQAGVDLAAFEQRLEGILDGQGFEGSLAEKLSFFVQAKSGSKLLEFQHDVLANAHPVMAAASGRACFAAVPNDGASTFEVRAYDPATGQEGVVVGRSTIQAAPSWLPAPDCLAELPEASPKGHLRVQLRWCYPLALRHRFLHYGGTRIIRANVSDWQAALGADPPLGMTREGLLQAIANGHADVVNGLPLFPEERPAGVADPSYALPLFTDDNDRVGEPSLDTGVGFTAGEEFVYWVWEEDVLGRPGHPSLGHRVTICDRLAPDPPLGLTATNQRAFQAGAAEDFIRLEWPAAPSDEVRRWYLYCSPAPNDPLEAYDPADPDVPGLLVDVIDNDGSHETADGNRIRFDHTSAFPVLPPGPGETAYYRLRAEDDTPCKDSHGRGNISGFSGAVPASRHDLTGPGHTGAWIEVPCCTLAVGHEAVQVDSRTPFTAILQARRPSDGFRWVEFRDQFEVIGRFEFAPGQDLLQVSYQPGDQQARTYGARFGHLGGIVSDWKDADAPDVLPAEHHLFEPRWICEPIPPLPTVVDPAPPRDCPGFLLPLDPETGEPHEICIRFSTLGGDLGSWIVYKQAGLRGVKTKLASGNVGDDPSVILQVCDSDFPPHGGEICYYVQGFDKDGNAGPMELAGCVKIAPGGGLPKPTITNTQPTSESNPEASANSHDIAWFCPPPVERFEVALSPASAAAGETFLEVSADGKIRSWGIIETPRTATGWGQSESEFLATFTLVHGVNYRCKVRAVAGVGEERDYGPWSDPETLHWLNQPGNLPEVPWPQRDAPGITGTAHMEWDTDDDILRVEIGELPLEFITAPLPADSMEPYLHYDLPFVAYLRDTTAGAKADMLQVSHRIDRILTKPAGNSGIDLADLAVKATPGQNDPLGKLWLRIDQPVLAGHTYEVFLLLMDSNLETREVLRSNKVQVPIILQTSK